APTSGNALPPRVDLHERGSPKELAPFLPPHELSHPHPATTSTPTAQREKAHDLDLQPPLAGKSCARPEHQSREASQVLPRRGARLQYFAGVPREVAEHRPAQRRQSVKSDEPDPPCAKPVQANCLVFRLLRQP